MPGAIALGTAVGLVTTFTTTAPPTLEVAVAGLVNNGGSLHAAGG